MTKCYHWYDNLQFFSMLLMAGAVPVSWRCGLWAAFLLAMVTIVKAVATRRVGNPALSPLLRWTLATPLIYWLSVTVSLLWSSDQATGWMMVGHKASLLVFPLCLLLSDTGYLTRNHLRAIGYALLLAMVGVFVFFVVKAGLKMLDGSTFADVTNATFDTRHHAYVALYATVALVFIYFELSRHWSALAWWHRCALIVTLLLMVCYVVLVNSRAGMLAMGMSGVMCVVHLAIVRRSWFLGLGVAVLLAAGLFGVTRLMPGYVDRLSATVENVEDDARTGINRGNWNAYRSSPLIGYGVGDYDERLEQQYVLDGFEFGIEAGFGPHNQYMESLLAVGIPGLLTLLLFLLSPFCVAAKQRRCRFVILLLTAIVMSNLLFESMLERQMGLLFIGYLYSVMVLIMSVEENKFARMQKC